MTITAELVAENKLRLAFLAEIDAEARVRTMRGRLDQAAAELASRRATRDNLPLMAAYNAKITGADLLKADAAIAEALADVELLTKAMPHVVAAARNAVQAAHGAAKEASERMPTAAPAELDAYLDGHGRDRFVAARVARFDLMEMS